MPDIVNNLVFATCTKDLDEKFQCGGFVTNLVKVLRAYFVCQPSVFRGEWKNILTRIVFPFMKPSTAEMESF